ncbi:uncharacterized protein V6R79_008742 [Siganus canaliculatus]
MASTRRKRNFSETEVEVLVAAISAADTERSVAEVKKMWSDLKNTDVEAVALRDLDIFPNRKYVMGVRLDKMIADTCTVTSPVSISQVYHQCKM